MQNGSNSSISCHKPPRNMRHFLLSDYLAYICTTNRNRKPHVSPSLFYWNLGSLKCEITFGQPKESQLIRNLRQIPVFSLTIDEKHPSESLKNRGIMVNAFAELSTDLQHCTQLIESLAQKYSQYQDQDEFQRFFDSLDVVVFGRITKIVHWQGPFFSRHICPINMDLATMAGKGWKKILQSHTATETRKILSSNEI